MPINRTYRCDDCELEWTVTHANSSEPYPDCPKCLEKAEWQPVGFSITGDKAKNVDTTYKILEEDYGLTNYKDKTYEGETGIILDKPQKEMVQMEAQLLKDMNNIKEQNGNRPDFWSGQVPGAGSALPAAQILQDAKAGAAAARAMKADPMAMLSKAGNAGKLKMPIQVVARAPLK